MSGSLGHTPVLLDAVVRHLAPQPGEMYADATAGLGGHASAIAPSLAPGGAAWVSDADPANVRRAADAVRAAAGEGVEVIERHGNFVGLPAAIIAAGTKADMLLADLGFASNQVDDPRRGLSFRSDGPLDMRFSPDQPRTAADLVNTLPEPELADLIRRLGEEPRARSIARKVVAARAAAPITTTAELAAVVAEGVRPAPRRPKSGGGRGMSIHPATRTFQALRIAVNDELNALEGLLEAIVRAAVLPADAAARWLAPGARVGIISFHSLEDRPVKRAFQTMVDRGLAQHLTRKPVAADEAELAQNPRSRSAKLRVISLVS